MKHGQALVQELSFIFPSAFHLSRQGIAFLLSSGLCKTERLLLHLLFHSWRRRHSSASTPLKDPPNNRARQSYGKEHLCYLATQPTTLWTTSPSPRYSDVQ